VDLVSLVRRSVDILRDNWILLAPTLIVHFAVPVIVMIAAALVVIPAIAVYLSSGGAVSVLPLVAVTGVVVVVVALIIVSFALAGQGYMNRRVALGEKTSMGDFLLGGRRYFAKVFGALLLLGILFGLPVVVLLGVALTAVGPIAPVSLGRMPETAREWTVAFTTVTPRFPILLLSLASTIFVVGLVELGVYMLTLPWLQAVVVEEAGLIGSFVRCFGFVRRNILSTLGYAGLKILVGGLIGGLFAIPFMSMPLLAAFPRRMASTPYLPTTSAGVGLIAFVANILIATFFTLLLFVMYVDRTRGLPAPTPQVQLVPPPQPPPTPSPPLVERYCIYCGSRIHGDAIYCHRCGRRQEAPP